MGKEEARITTNSNQNRKKRNKVGQRKNETNGITLIALVVTIVILIILATISINTVFGENGLIAKSEQSKAFHELEKERERLELIKTQVATDVVNLGKVTVDNYVEELIKENITVEAEVTDNGDGSKTVITDTGYSVTILPKGDRDVEIIIDGKAGALPPRIVDVTLTREGTTIIVNVQAIRTEGATYKYYYKIEGGEYQTEAVNSENTGSYTITGIDESEEYIIKVELSNEYGRSTKEVSEKDRRPIVIYKDGKQVKESIITNHEKIEGEDRLGNKITLPKGFRTAKDTGETMQDGIVIEDDEGNQFVWIPVSNISHDGTNKIIKNDGSEVEITLGRYTFDGKYNSSTGKVEGTGTETKVQYGSEYAATTIATVAAGTVSQYAVDRYHYELTDSRISNNSNGIDATNTTAKNLQAFIESVRDNHGYYLARYEASHSSTDPTKPASKVADVWNYVNQPEAAKASRNMYTRNTKVEVESDLCNSYGWDTAIVYIQAMGHSNYANANKYTTILKTGETGDEVCKVFDMAANTREWTTEYTTYAPSVTAYPATDRYGRCTSHRQCSSVAENVACDAITSFRVSLYL